MMGGGGRRGGRGGPQWNGPPGGGGRGGRGGRGGDDRWGHKGLPPDQQGDGRRGGGRRGGFGNYGAPVNNRHDPRLPQLQQTENKFVAIDKSKLDEEEKKQRAFKSILNKLTPQNFEKLLEQILAEGIDEAQTLIGLIGQLFDKALTEPTFAELYAMMCQQLSNRFLAENIEFVDPDCDPDAEGGPRMINFKRVLLNKCQEEFEKGDSAIKAVEQEEIDDENEKNGEDAAKEEEKEEGEVPAKPKTPEELELDKRRKIQEREDRMRQARRRMLGNIRFIGELFKKEMLTARIMHTCIMKLLNEKKNPRRGGCRGAVQAHGDNRSAHRQARRQIPHGRLLQAHPGPVRQQVHFLQAQVHVPGHHGDAIQGLARAQKRRVPRRLRTSTRMPRGEAMNQARGGGPRGAAAAPATSAAARPRTAAEGTARGGGRDSGRGGGRDSGRELARASRRRSGRPRAIRAGAGAGASARLGPRSDLGRGGGRSGVPEPPAAAAGGPAGATRPGLTRAPARPPSRLTSRRLRRDPRSRRSPRR